MERSDKKRKFNAFRLFCRVRVDNKYHKVGTAVTFKPKGKNKSHDTLLREILESVKSYSSILDVFLIAESEQTNHFHGIIITKDKCKFSRFFNKKSKFSFHIKYGIPLYDWCYYIVKHTPDKLYVNDTVEFFNKPFLSDKIVARYEP